MYKLKNCIAIFLISLLIIACKEEMPGTLSKGKAVPGVVTSLKVENLPGGAKLTYVLPTSEDLLYVKAVYEFPKGTKREVKSSVYTDSLVIEGIGSTDELDVQIYSVSRSEVLSAPVTVKIKPLTPPVKLVGISLKLREDFGGVISNFENVNQANVSIWILRKDGQEWTPIETYYTNKRSGFFNARGQKAESQEFGVFAKDKWGNRSDTLKIVLTPLFEEQIPSPVPVTTLPGDYNLHYQSYNYTYLFDGITQGVLNYMGTLLNSPASKMPLSFTMDFKKPTIFSRLKYWPRMDGGSYYNRGTPEMIEVYGSNTLSDNWSAWTKIAECTTVKPSGKPLGQLSQEDIDASLAGYDCSFPSNPNAYRYLRWKTLKNFGSVDYVQMTEVTFWGDQQ